MTIRQIVPCINNPTSICIFTIDICETKKIIPGQCLLVCFAEVSEVDQNTSSESDVAPQSHHLLHPSHDKIYTTSTIGQDKSADILNTDDSSTSSSFTHASGIRMEPFQPCNIKFPVTVIGKKRRGFKPEWFKTYPWLEWDSAVGGALCHCCRMATKLNLITFSHCADNAFTTRGFRNWKHAHEKFKSHAVTSHHKEAAMKFANYVGGKSISAEMHNNLQTEQAQHRLALLQLFSTLRFLA